MAPSSVEGFPQDWSPDGYTVEREIGHGGMATVYAARDTKHGRRVALKVLRPELAATMGAERFRREITLAASLQHPHIVSVYDSGETRSGFLWFTMPLIEGESLRARLSRERQLPLGDAVRIAREVAEALDYAHQQGILHRDIKPENILLSRGHALVADFGVARALSASDGRAGPADRTLTETGMALGTPTYMSPEQATGERTLDPRTDVYALGCVLFEMLAGEPPYTGATTQALLAKRVGGDIPSVRRVRSAVPASVDAVIARCLAPVPADRFAAAGELTRALDGAPSAPHTGGATPATRVRDQVGGRFALLALGICVGAGVLFAWRHLASGFAPATTDSAVGIAVLPFDAGGDTANAYFADGIAGEIQSKLSALPRLRVIASASSNQYRRSQKPLQQIGRELGVHYLLMGHVQWEQGVGGTRRVRVSPELVELREGSAPESKWRQSYDTTVADIFDVQTAVASHIADKLGVVLSPVAATRLAARPTNNVAAYNAYLRSVALRNADPATLDRALAAAEQAVALDSGFAAAWARISTLRLYHDVYSLSPRADDEAARVASDRAIALAPEAEDGYLARGHYDLNAGNDYAGARAAFETAIALAPSSSDATRGLGATEASLGHWSSALPLYHQAAVLDPRSPDAALALSVILLDLRRYREARVEAERALTLAPAEADIVGILIPSWLGEGDLRAAQAALRDFSHSRDRAAVAAYVASTDLYWVLDSADRALVLTLPPGAFGDNRAIWAGVRAELHWLAHDTGAARPYADSSRVAFEAELGGKGDQIFWLHSYHGLMLAFLGERGAAVREAERGLQLALAAGGHLRDIPESRRLLAWIDMLAGDHSRAIEQLDTLLANPYFISPAWLKIDPTWDPLRGDPGFERLIAQPATSPVPRG